MVKKQISLVLSLIMLVYTFSFATPQTVEAATQKGIITSAYNTNSGIRVKWNKDLTKKGYYIYRKAGSSGWKQIKKVTKNSTSSMLDKNTKNGTKYVYKVCSYKVVKVTEEDEITKETITKNETVISKTNVTKTIVRLVTPKIFSVDSPDSGQVIVDGSRNSKATGFQIQFSRKSDFTASKRITISGTKISSNLIKGLYGNKNYYFRIRSYKTLNNVRYYSAYSIVTTCITNDYSDYSKEIVALAKTIDTQWKTAYIHSAINSDSNGKHGFDCSGFVSYCLNSTMQKYNPLYRVSSNVQKMGATDIIFNAGEIGEFKAVTTYEGKWDSSQVNIGDVLFFNLPSYNKYECGWNHCGIYIGSNKMIHCTKSANGVIRAKMEGTYSKNFVKAMNFVPNEIIPINKFAKTIEKTSIYADSSANEKISTLNVGTEIIVLFTRDNKIYAQLPDGEYYYMFHMEKLEYYV